MSATAADEIVLPGYGEDLSRRVAERACRFAAPAQKKLPLGSRFRKLFAGGKPLARLVADLTPEDRHALAILRRLPRVAIRWDHAVRLLSAIGVPSPYRVLQTLLADGLALMRSSRPGEDINRFEVPDGLPRDALPSIGVNPLLLGAELELPAPVEPLAGVTHEAGWRQADGWELPIRVGLVWRMAWHAPIKRTQQNVLFKRDLERLQDHSLLGAPMLDEQASLPDVGLLAYALSVGDGWLVGEQDEQSPAAPLPELWPDSLEELLLRITTSLMGVETWNELGSHAPPGLFASEIASARLLVLLWLSSLAPEDGVTVAELSRKLEASHPPWAGEAEPSRFLRQSELRTKLAQDWTRSYVLGALYQLGVVAAQTTAMEGPLVRLTPLGRRFVGELFEIPSPPAFPQSMLAQPNHQLVVYRQALRPDLLSRLLVFAEPRTIGAALTFEINADSVYHGMEAGCADEGIIEFLTENGGREPPPGLVESIRTWARKRSRLSVYSDVPLFEFHSEADLQEAVNRGLEGIAITPRLLLATGDVEQSYAHLKITASRDYRFAAEQCVETGPDGVTLKVDLAKSDLMLETELRRFADSLDLPDATGRRLYRVTTESIGRALQQGMRIVELEEWFTQRTGQGPPPSVSLLIRAAIGVEVSAASPVVLSADSSQLVDGLLQHPWTAELVGQRLGPTSLVVPRERLSELREALDSLGVRLKMEEPS